VAGEALYLAVISRYLLTTHHIYPDVREEQNT